MGVEGRPSCRYVPHLGESRRLREAARLRGARLSLPLLGGAARLSLGPRLLLLRLLPRLALRCRPPRRCRSTRASEWAGCATDRRKRHGQ